MENEYQLLDNEIEQKLYLIKCFKYKCDEEFKKKYNFSFNISLDNNYLLVVNIENNQKYTIRKEARIFDFIINKETKKRYIYSESYLKIVFKELKIQYYSLEKPSLDNSLDSEISDSDLCDIFFKEDITKIYKVVMDEDKIINLFNNKFISDTKTISALSTNSNFYYPNNKDEELNVDIFADYFKKLKKQIVKDGINIIFFLGPKNSSKSLFLLYFSTIHHLDNFPVLYINYEVLKKVQIKDRKYILKKEMVYLFFDQNKFLNFYKEKIYRKIANKDFSFIYNLKEFIKELINIYENTFDKTLTLIIDNFNEIEKELFGEMDEIINLAKKNPSKIKIILSGNSNYFNKKIELYLKNKNFSDIIDKQLLFLYYVKFESKDEIKSLAGFNFKKITDEQNLEKVLLDDEIKYCSKFNIYGMHYSIINNGKKIPLNNLIKYINILPIEYLSFLMNEDETVTFKYYNPIFLKAVKQSIKSIIKENSLSFLLSEDNKDFVINGIYEEKLLCTLISYNKLNLENMVTSENNLLEVEKICLFKEQKFKKYKENIDIKLPIIITQEIFLAELYDLLILIPEEESKNNEFAAYMIQIGTNKIKSQIDDIKNDFEGNKKKYVNGIKKFIDNDININNIELIFIFDKSTQQKLFQKKAKSYEFGCNYCTEKDIKYYCFCVDSYKLYASFQESNYYEIRKFGNFDRYGKRNWTDYNRIRFSFLKDDEIKFINSKIDVEVKSLKCIYYEENITFPKKIENKFIYVIFNDSNKYYIIDNIIYYKYDNEFKSIDKKEIDKTVKFSTVKIRNNNEDMIKSKHA